MAMLSYAGVRRIGSSSLGLRLAGIAGGLFGIAPAVAQCALTLDNLGGSAPGNLNVFAVASIGGGEVVAGGQFDRIGGAVTSQIAKWDGSAWSAIGGGLAPFNAIFAVCLRPNGELIAGGQEMGLLPTPPVYANIARWDGATWAPLGAGVAGNVQALANLANGDLAVAGTFGFAAGQAVHGIARWDGSAWSPIGAGFDGSGPFTAVAALAVMPNGDLIAGGNFTSSGGASVLRVARWNGTTWSQVGAGFDGQVQALLVLSDGDIIAGGSFTQSGSVAVSHIARFDGSAWGPLGPGLSGDPNFASVSALAQLPNGDLVAGGYCQFGGAPPVGLARWNGLAWSPIGVGANVSALAFDQQHMLLAGGTFWQGPARGIARLATTCPAGVEAAPSGCVSNGGQLEVAKRAWLGSTWRTVANGLPPGALAFSILGYGTMAMPLASVFATAIPGCQLLVVPDDVSLRLTNGDLEVELAIPPTPGLVGASFHHQIVSLAFDPSLAVAATNALTMTVGSF